MPEEEEIVMRISLTSCGNQGFYSGTDQTYRMTKSQFKAFETYLVDCISHADVNLKDDKKGRPG